MNFRMSNDTYAQQISAQFYQIQALQERIKELEAELASRRKAENVLY